MGWERGAHLSRERKGSNGLFPGGMQSQGDPEWLGKEEAGEGSPRARRIERRRGRPRDPSTPQTCVPGQRAGAGPRVGGARVGGAALSAARGMLGAPAPNMAPH